MTIYQSEYFEDLPADFDSGEFIVNMLENHDYVADDVLLIEVGVVKDPLTGRMRVSRILVAPWDVDSTTSGLERSIEKFLTLGEAVGNSLMFVHGFSPQDATDAAAMWVTAIVKEFCTYWNYPFRNVMRILKNERPGAQDVRVLQDTYRAGPEPDLN